MTIIRTVWYSCGLMVMATLLLSVMTVVPAAEAERTVAYVVCLGFAILLAVAGRSLSQRFRRNPADAFLTSKAWSRAFVAAAVILTFAMLTTIA